MAPRDHANKYLCKICNIWIADNKPQRDQHENGQKHKAAKVRLLKEIAKKNEASRRAAGKPMLANVAAQQMLETVALTTKERAVVDKFDNEMTIPKEAIDVDDNAFPLPADHVYGWKDVDDGVEYARNDYITTDALGEFAPDVEETPAEKDETEGDPEVDKDGKFDGTSVPTVAANEDPVERKQLESAFKKRVAPKNRRKRRAR